MAGARRPQPLHRKAPALTPPLTTRLRLTLTTLITNPTALLAERRRDDRQRGSVTLEQVAIAAGLLAIALAAIVVVGSVVASYTNKLN